MKLVVLSSFESRSIDAVFDAFYPGAPDGPFPIGALAMFPSRFFADLLARAPFEAHLALRAALWLVALSPLFVLGRACSFTRLSRPERERVLERLLASRIYAIRQLALGLKAAGGLLFARSETVRALATRARAEVVSIGRRPSVPPPQPVGGRHAA